MPNNISLFPQPTNQQISLSAESLPSLAWTANRAYQFAYGLGDVMGKDYDEFHGTIAKGGEMDLRREAAATVDQASLQSKLDKIRERPEMAGTFLDTQATPTNPNYVLEHSYAQKYMARLFQGDGDSDIKDATKALPQTAEATGLIGEELATKQRKVANKFHDIREKYNQQSWGSYAVDLGKGFVPFYNQLETTGKVGLYGKNLNDTAMNYWRLPMGEFTQKFDKEIDKLADKNPGAALELLGAMYGMSHNDQLWHNIGGAMDIAFIPGIAKLPKVIDKLMTLRGGVRSMFKSTALDENPEVAAARGAGDVGEASRLKATEHIIAEMRGEDTGLKKAWDTISSHMKTFRTEAEANWGNSSRELLARTLTKYDAAPTRLWNLIMQSVRSERTPLHRATPEQLKKIQEEIVDSYPRYKDGQLDITGPHENPITKTSEYLLHMGTKDGKLFKSKELAKNTSLYRTQIRDLEVVQEGEGYKYLIPLPIPETNPLVQQLFLEVPQALPTYSWLNAWVGWLRNPGDTLAHDQMLNRVAASYAPTNFYKMFREEAKDIQKLRGTFFKKKRFKDFEDFIKSAQQEDENGELGRDYKGAADINDWFTRNKGRVAEEQEIAAYHSFKRLVEMDWMMRQVMVNINKSRVGAKNWRVYHASKEGNTVYSSYFDAMEITPSQGFPKDTEALAMIVGKNGKHEMKRISQSLGNQLAEGFQQGKIKVLQVYNPYDTPLSKYANSQNPIKYVITDQYERRELQWDSLPHRKGGHFEYTYDHYVKEPMFRQDTITKYWHYMGDRTIAAVSLRGMGKDYAQNMNQIRKHIREGKLDEARDLHNRTIPEESWEDHLAAYSSSGSGKDFKPARMDINSDVYVVPHNRQTTDIDRSILENKRFEGKVVNGTRSYSQANMSQVQFTGERDAVNLRELINEGTHGNPVFGFAAAKQIDPLPMLNRGWNRLINNFFVDDVKKSAIEAWVKQAKDELKEGIARIADSSPYRVYMEADTNSFKNTDMAKVRQLMFNKQKIDQFIGMPSKLDSFVWQGAQALADSIYAKYGPKWALVPTKMLPFVKDPFRALRSLVFNEKVGLFSIPQFLVHLTTYSTLLGVAGPMQAVPGSFAAMLHLWSRMNPHILEHLDKMASSGVVRFGKPGEFAEAQRLGESTGFFRSEHEHAQQDSIMTNQIVRSGTNRFLHWGQFFFRAGLSSVRTAAWYTAYREFRTKNPLRTIGNAEKLEILNRADLLAHNMSRAHSSILNQGVLANTTQFYTYQQRLIEMAFPFFGKRLTFDEKVRLYATNALLFGVPIAAAVSPAGIGPVTEHLKGEAIKAGYTVGDNFIESLIMEGAIDQGMAIVSGGGDWSKGTHYNPGGRYGTKGLEWDTMREDEHIWEWALGASYQTGINTLEEMDGIFRGGISGIKSIMGIPQPEGEQYPITADTLIKPFREASIVNIGARFEEAVRTGAWWTKNGRKMEDNVSVGEALMMSLTGLQRKSTEDAFTYADLRKGEKKYMEETRRLFFNTYSKYLQALENNDYEQGKEYFSQGQQILISRGYPVELLSKVYAEGNKAYKPLGSKLRDDYELKDVPMGRRDTAEEAYRKQDAIDKLKGNK